MFPIACRHSALLPARHLKKRSRSVGLRHLWNISQARLFLLSSAARKSVRMRVVLRIAGRIPLGPEFRRLGRACL